MIVQQKAGKGSARAAEGNPSCHPSPRSRNQKTLNLSNGFHLTGTPVNRALDSLWPRLFQFPLDQFCGAGQKATALAS